MSINLIVGGSITKTSKGQTTYEVLDGNFNSYAGKNNVWQGEQKINYNDYTPPKKEEENIDKNEDFYEAWWSVDYKGEIRLEYDTKEKTGYRSQLEDTVYFNLRVNKKVPLGTQIKFKLWDYDSLFFMDWLSLDDDGFGKEGKELYKTGVVKDVGDSEYNRITINLFLTPEWKEKLEEDKGPFKDGCLDFHWTWKYGKTNYEINESLILRVYYKRNLFIKKSNSSYPFPELIESTTGDFLVFLKNEGGDVVGSIETKIDRFYAVRVTITAQYEFEGRTNKVTKKLFEERINLSTGEIESKQTFEIKELVEFKAKNSKIIKKLDSTEVEQVKKKIADYYNIYDIGHYGIKTLQTAMEIFGYIDLFNDINDAVAGKGLSTYDTLGLGTAMAEQATKVAIVQETKMDIMTAEEIAMMSLPEWITPVSFGLAIFEETISKPFVAQTMQYIEEAMFMKMEEVKRKGLDAVRMAIGMIQGMSDYYTLIIVSQKKHNAVFANKIKTYSDLIKDNNTYIDKSNQKNYTYLIAIVDTENSEDKEFHIDAIFI